MDCPICSKHQNLESHTGPLLWELGGWWLSHFPLLSDEPTTKGHLVVETRRHVQDLTELNDEEAKALGQVIKYGAGLIQNRLGAEHTYVFRLNDKVSHLHFHLIPRYGSTPREFWGHKILTNPNSPKLKTLAEIHNLVGQLQ